MSGSSSPQTPKSPKQSKLGSIGKKLIDGIRQMEIAADSWQAPGELNGLQSTYIRERPRFQNGPMNREVMMLEMERAKRLQELEKLQQDDDVWRRNQATRSPSERSNISMQTHSRQHDDSARRLQQELADLELRKRALQEQQEQTEQQWREQTEHHDRQLQERMEALNRSPEMVPPPSQDYGASPPQEEPYGQFYTRDVSPQIPTTGSRSPTSPRAASGAMPATPLAKVDELYSRMSNDELKQLTAMSNVPSFDKIPLATPAMKPHDSYQHSYQQQQQQQQHPYQGQRGYQPGGMRPAFSRQPSGATSSSSRPPWEKWDPRQRPPYETMDDLRARSAPLYRDHPSAGSGGAGAAGGMGRPHPSERMRPRANSDSSQSDPFGLEAGGPFGHHQGYGGSSSFDNNPFEDYQHDSSLDQINPEDIFGTGGNSSFDDDHWPPPTPNRGEPFAAWPNGQTPQGRSRTTSESSVPFGETFPRPAPQPGAYPHPMHRSQSSGRRPRTNSMNHQHHMHPRRPEPSASHGWNGQGPAPSGRPSQSRMRSNSGPPRPDWAPGAGPPRDQQWMPHEGARSPRDWNRHQQQQQQRQQSFAHPNREQWPEDERMPQAHHHRISRDDIAQARARADEIRRQREEHEWRTRRQHHQDPSQYHDPRRPPQNYRHPQDAPPVLDGLSDQDLSYLISDPIVRDLVLSRLPAAEQRSVMDRLHRMGPVQVDENQPGPAAAPQQQTFQTQASDYRPPGGFQNPRAPPPGSSNAPFPTMSPRQAAPGVRFQDDEDDDARTPMASPRMPNTPFSVGTPLSARDMPAHYPGKPPAFPGEPARSAEFRVHRQGAPMDGLENLQVIQHLTSYPPASTGPVPSDQNELVTGQILDLVSRAKNLGATALMQLQTRELPSGQYIVEGDAVQ